ncbi:hypothetical protein GSI_13532 [Ganoderma sinense ZZ0214-1]|uniref:Cytochrome b561 domain-containing protein n=1 Tax=Ganoderma sinense ZZ0214-1 TaxID=1077348 RepID=A0A2G8RQK4_9APHY|nr:hypothetical protein GSI_13532 [Ganoderma sinense ZZ0214-1]
MCVTATVNSTIATYELKSLNQLGWMAIGFGSHMANSPMVILWQTVNGTVILSQRQATGRVEPLPVTDPPRRATVALRDHTSQGVSTILAFDIPKNNDTIQSLVWAFGVTAPAADPSAFIQQHLDAGAFSLNLSKELEVASVSASGPTASSTQLGGPSIAVDPAPPQSSPVTASNLLHTDGLLVAHAALSAAGFLILLPLGTLVARWARVFTPRWFTAHWFINVVLGIPLVCVGWALGPLAVAQRGRAHVVTPHQICGVALIVLYIFQLALGTLVHLRRPKDGKGHPPRNVGHVVLGLAVFGLSIYTTISGVDRDAEESGASQRVVVAICIGWAAVFAGTYSIGLLFLRRQLAQERLGWNVPESVPVPLPVMVAGTRASSELVAARRRATTVVNRLADDGTHDMFSPPAWVSSLEAGGEAAGEEQTRTEMRQVQAVPVSLSAFI